MARKHEYWGKIGVFWMRKPKMTHSSSQKSTAKYPFVSINFRYMIDFAEAFLKIKKSLYGKFFPGEPFSMETKRIKEIESPIQMCSYREKENLEVDCSNPKLRGACHLWEICCLQP